MLSRLALGILAAAFVIAGYVDIYVDNGPDVEDLHLYAWNGSHWAPVYVVYQPQYVDTYIVSVGQWASMPYYNMSRYVLRIPREALAPRGPPQIPPGLERWILEVENGTRKTAVTLAAGREPLRRGNETLATWKALGKEEVKTPNRGKINKPEGRPRSRSQGEGPVAGDIGVASYAVPTGATIYPIGSLYFKPVTVAGTFSAYMPVDSPTGETRICLDNVHWVGFEVQNFTVGVKVDGYVTGGYLTLEFYNIGTCAQVGAVSLPLPNYGIYWTNIQTSLPQDNNIGVRIRVSGRSEVASIYAYVVARYRKVVESPAQVATSKAMSTVSPSVSASNRDKVGVLFGPYVAFDGLASDSTGWSYSNIYIPPSTVRLTWYGQYCPSLSVEYYVNGVFYGSALVAPVSWTNPGYACDYNVPSRTLQIRARDYAVAKANSAGGGISVSVVYRIWKSNAAISFSGSLQIVYDRWIEPFRSRYIEPTRGLPYLEWGVTLLYNTFQVLGPINNTSINLVTELRASNSRLMISLAHNQLDPMFHICGAEWVITAPVQSQGFSVYYDGSSVDEPWWASMGRRVLDAIDWMLTLLSLAGKDNPYASIAIKIVYDMINAATPQVSITSSSGVYTIRWSRGWADPIPSHIVLDLARTSVPTNAPAYAEWRYFREGRPTTFGCILSPFYYVVNTNMYLPQNSISSVGQGASLVWTWRGQTNLISRVVKS
ncbi:MAG: hypothetical protein QW259_07130 [Pyrobaculum sp.]